MNKTNPYTRQRLEVASEWYLLTPQLKKVSNLAKS